MTYCQNNDTYFGTATNKVVKNSESKTKCSFFTISASARTARFPLQYKREKPTRRSDVETAWILRLLSGEHLKLRFDLAICGHFGLHQRVDL